MKKLYLQSEFKKAKSKDKLPCECYQCKKIFYLSKHYIQCALNPNHRNTAMYCSKKCEYNSRLKEQEIECKNCKGIFIKKNSEIKKTKNHFCSRSCSITYRNTHKTIGTKRSKLEVYFEEQLKSLYPNLCINFNKKDAISSELDIYIPSLKLAFELNGIFHYKPIFGPEKLKQIQENDQRKFQECIKNNISLCIINTSSLTYFKKEKADAFLNIVKTLINKTIP